MTRARAVPALLALLSGGCGKRCPDGSSVSFVLSGMGLQRYSVTLVVGGRRLQLDCPDARTVEGWPVSCGEQTIAVTTLGVEVERISQALLTVTTPDGVVLAQDRVVALGPPIRFAPDEETCSREGLVALDLADHLLQLAPGSHDFGAVPAGRSSAPFAFTVSNTGASVSGTPQVTISGDFVPEAPLCERPLGPGERCEVNVVFRPARAGLRQGTLTVTSLPGGTVTASLAGTSSPPDGGVPEDGGR